ncbi:MAG: hypothetical protein COB14_00285 [Alphaproteobacteria bacterium]|nr:MAG: hypothetical protein COB14_00285 [Alphaproteobacteria bacterium]
MSIAKEFHFDVLMTDVKAQTQPKIFEILAQEAAPLCEVEVGVLSDVLDQNAEDRTFPLEDGVAIFDVKSTHIKTPALAMMTFDRDIAFNTMDGKLVNIMAAVLSPQSCGPVHLQRLANVSRILRSHDLCMALREVDSADAMRALFMPTQDWMLAA